MEIIENKKQLILNAAVKRFSHFGIAKTSMSEIADDVQVSKTNLYYYFPDKNALIEAVVNQFVDETEQKIQSEVFGKHSGVLERLNAFIDLQFEYFSNYRLLIQNIQEFNSNDPKIRSVADVLYAREVQVIEKILSEGIEKGEVKEEDVEEKAKLYVQIIKSMTHMSFCSGHQLNIGLVDLEYLDEVRNNLKNVVNLLYYGLYKH